MRKLPWSSGSPFAVLISKSEKTFLPRQVVKLKKRTRAACWTKDPKPQFGLHVLVKRVVRPVALIAASAGMAALDLALRVEDDEGAAADRSRADATEHEEHGQHPDGPHHP